MLTPQVRIIPLANALLRLAQWSSKFHCFSSHDWKSRFTHPGLMFSKAISRFLSSSTFSPPLKLAPPAGTLPDLIPSVKEMLACSLVDYIPCSSLSFTQLAISSIFSFHNMDSIDVVFTSGTSKKAGVGTITCLL